jgi:SAM-dependent methyltransferase
MKRPDFLARQARQPSGILGWLIGSIMAGETRAMNAAVLAALALEPTDSLLDVGFGPGVAVELASQKVTQGFVGGADFSEPMVKMARGRCSAAIAEGRVQLAHVDSSKLPFEDARFDKVLSVHTIYFWPDPLAQLREIHRVLRGGGRLALGVRKNLLSAGTASFPPGIFTFYDDVQIAAMLQRSGFDDVRTVDAPVGDGRFSIVTATRV